MGMKGIPRANATQLYVLAGYSIVATLAVLLLWRSSAQEQQMVFHGVSQHVQGSCWCSRDSYCLCTPSLAIDAIIEMDVEGERSVVMVERRDGMGFALVGGFVDVGESVEQATIREVYEETGLTVKSVKQFRVYSEPTRDPRRHTVSVVMIVHAEGVPRAADDAKDIAMLPLHKAPQMKLAFDHEKILRDYLEEHPQF